jgi:hypothetical protein
LCALSRVDHLLQLFRHTKAMPMRAASMSAALLVRHDLFPKTGTHFSGSRRARGIGHRLMKRKTPGACAGGLYFAAGGDLLQIT